MAIQLPIEDDLQELYEEATANQSAEEFVNRTLENVAKTLKRNPLFYRAYGPYWWLLKQMLIERHGQSLFSEGNLDKSMLNQLSFSSPAYGLVAAWQYAEWQFEMGAQANTQHELETDDGDSTTYELFDEELEVLAAQQKIIN